MSERLDERRPEWLLNYISADYAAVRQMDPFDRQYGEGYGFNGAAETYYFRYQDHDDDCLAAILAEEGLSPEVPIDLPAYSTDDILKSVTPDPQGSPTTVLDVGCGAGGLMKHCMQKGFAAYGVTAHDYRLYPRYDFANGFTDDQYRVGDAHFLSQVVAPYDGFGLVTSMHCVGRKPGTGMREPLGTLEQMANLVRVGGILAVESFDSNLIYDDDLLVPIRPNLFGGKDTVETLLDAGFRPFDQISACMLRAEIDPPDNVFRVPPIVMQRTESRPVRFAADFLRLSESESPRGFAYVKQ
jgi:hypothetical protein